jgi:hypothetical protein
MEMFQILKEPISKLIQRKDSLNRFLSISSLKNYVARAQGKILSGVRFSLIKLCNQLAGTKVHVCLR